MLFAENRHFNLTQTLTLTKQKFGLANCVLIKRWNFSRSSKMATTRREPRHAGVAAAATRGAQNIRTQPLVSPPFLARCRRPPTNRERRHAAQSAETTSGDNDDAAVVLKFGESKRRAVRTGRRKVSSIDGGGSGDYDDDDKMAIAAERLI